MKTTRKLHEAVIGCVCAGVLSGFNVANAAPVLMSSEWAAQACDAWNEDPVLTDRLVKKWIKNDQDRGYKVVHLYRQDCTDSARVELRLSEVSGRAVCMYGGEAQTKELNKKSDYLMWAKTSRWEEMGAGRYGPLRAMLTYRLKVKGPKFEAIRHLAPLKNLLLLTGKVLSDTSSCP